jgi:uncharacterized protein
MAGLFDNVNALRWLRKMHGWIGLWGAALGLIFGFSGIWLNHRAVLKLPPVFQERSNVQLALPDPVPASTQAMAQWLQGALRLESDANAIRVEAARAVAWAEKAGSPQAMMQPERWVFNFGGPNTIIQAEYWQGNRSVSVSTTANGFVATLSNMHKGVGMPVAWILLIDTLAGSVLFLSLSGVLLWVQTNRRRTVGATIAGSSVLLTLALVAMRI